MAATNFGMETLTERGKELRSLLRDGPKPFWVGLIGGLLILTVAAMVVLGAIQTMQPTLRPSLTLAADTVTTGEYLGFVQGLNPAHRCVEESVRVVWRWDAEKKRPIVTPLADFNPIPNMWKERAIIQLKLPENLPPGEYFYRRETAQWCSIFNFLFGPTINETPDIPFRVVAAPVAR